MTMFFKSKSSSNSSFGVRYGGEQQLETAANYDVFLSFRGEDTRKNFIDHLYNALVQVGIHTFRDDNELSRGEEISQQLLKTIQDSRISIVVFSKGYASSTWCLNELAKIMECKNTVNQIVLPVFYDIEPSDIRKQKRSFSEAFKAHEECFKEEMERVNKWRAALKEASSLSGFPLKDMANGHESTFIQQIIQDVLNKLNRKYLHVAKHRVGIDSRVDNMLARLGTETNYVRIVGIHGMPGIGKTTIAKVVFNQLCNTFEGSCFLKNVAETSKQHNGLVQLQKELLCEILKRDRWNINNEDRGINLINERLRHKRVLVVLDDVEHKEQLDALVGEGCLFGRGSIIIITTRDERLLNLFEVVVKYQAQLLNEDESLQLFSWNAFRDTCPPKDYVELSKKVVDYCGGLPLALEVLGSSLSKKDKIRWECVIDKLRKIPNHNIQEKLRISFDTLDDDTLRNTFLDIACFLIGREKEFVAKVLEACRGFNPEDDLGTLIERSLITINCLGEIKMHDLLRDMGREIIRQISPDHPGKRNRIWHHEDAWNVLIRQTGTKVVEGLALDVGASKVEPLSTKSFIKMRNLELLKINGVHVIGCFKVLPKELIWLCWHRCPLKSLPSDFELGNLVILDMQYSNIRELWKETKMLNRLKILDLSYCKDFAKTPNFLGLSNLERLILKNCTSLVEVPQSIGHLKMLVFLSLEGCSKLKILSESICDVKSLQTLNVSGCSQLEKLPKNMGDMESLTELLVDGIENEQFLSSIAHLKYVRKLSLCGYSFNQDLPSSTSWVSLISSWLSRRTLNWKVLLPTFFASWRLVRKLELGSCGLFEDATNCVDFRSITFLEELDLSENRFFHLPSGIGCLRNLRFLNVKGCKNLLSISELPSSLWTLMADGCASMERVILPIQEKTSPFLGVGMVNGLRIYSNDCYRLSDQYKASLVKEWSSNNYGGEFYFPSGDMPNWFSYRGEKCSLLFHLPPFVQGLAIWIVFETEKNGGDTIVTIKNKSNDIHLFPNSLGGKGELTFYTGIKAPCLASWVCYVPADERAMKGYSVEEWELYLKPKPKKRGEIEAVSGCKVKELGVHVIVEKPNSFEESEWEWNHDIDNLQGITSSTDVEEEYEIDSQTGTDVVTPKLYHLLHHLLLGSIACSTKEQWKFYLQRELLLRDIDCVKWFPIRK